jgi:predicted ArsR family transcriptional regulator
MDRASFERQVAAIAPLADPVRRRVYLYVRGRGCDVGRDEAARAVGISRPLAAFHLDKLAQYGLLDASFRRLNRRRGPGAGRPAKLYRRSKGQVSLALPERHYELAARLFLDALNAAPSPAALGALGRLAAKLGRTLGEAAGRPRRAAAPRWLDRVETVLDRWGYEPSRRAGETHLENCPFGALVQQCPPIVCRMNLALIRGVLRGIGARGVAAELRPEPGACCVVLRSAPSPL